MFCDLNSRTACLHYSIANIISFFFLCVVIRLILFHLINFIFILFMCFMYKCEWLWLFIFVEYIFPFMKSANINNRLWMGNDILWTFVGAKFSHSKICSTLNLHTRAPIHSFSLSFSLPLLIFFMILAFILFFLFFVIFFFFCIWFFSLSLSFISVESIYIEALSDLCLHLVAYVCTKLHTIRSHNTILYYLSSILSRKKPYRFEFSAKKSIWSDLTWIVTCLFMHRWWR